MSPLTPRLRLVDSPPATDAELCQRFLHGDTAAFGVLVQRHQEQVLRLLRRYAPDSDAALELAQRAYLQAFEAARRALPKFSSTSSATEVPFRAWLLRIAINLGKNHVRDARRWMRAPLEVVDQERRLEPVAPQRLEQAQREQLTRAAVLELPKRQREVFTLRVDLGLPFAEVAATLGISEGNAKSHFHYAVKRLQQRVHDRLKGEAQ